MKKAAVESFWVSVIFIILVLIVSMVAPKVVPLAPKNFWGFLGWFVGSFVGTFIYRGIIKQGK